MAESLIFANTPIGTEADLINIKGRNLANATINPATIPDKPLAPLSKEMMQSISQNAATKANSTSDNPFKPKEQDASLSERYIGKQVYYGDYELDPKILDNRYSKTQSWWEQTGNNAKVGIANGSATFISGMLALPDIIRNIATGAPLSESEVTKNLYNWRESVANENINFQNEQDNKTDAWNTIKNTLLPSFVTGSTTGWGSVFENMAYGVGAGLSIAAQEALVTAIAPGVGNSAVLANGVARVINNVNKLREYSQLADRIIEGSNTIINTTRALNQGNRIVDASKWAYRATIGAYGEAGFEGEEARHSLKTSLTQKYRDQHGYDPTGSDLENINKLADEGANARFWSNMALLMGSNSFQFKRLFRNLDLAKEELETLSKQGLKISLNESSEAVAKKAFELKSNWWTNGFGKHAKSTVEALVPKISSDFAQESLSEGLEEFTQNWIDKAVNNYTTWKLDHRGQSSIDQAIKSISEGFSESWNTEGLKAFLSGAIAGVAQQALFSAPNIGKQRDLQKAKLEALNNTLSEYNNFDVKDFASALNINSLRGTVTDKAAILNSNGVIDKVAEIATEVNDKKVYKDLETLSFYNLAQPYISKGHADILKQQFAFSLENSSDEQVQQLFGNENLTKDNAILEFNSRVDEMNKSYSKIKQAFRNPYSATNQLNEYKTFEDYFIPHVAYLDYRAKELNKRRNDIQETLGDYYEEFKFFANQKDISKGKSYINEQIKTYKSDESYLKTIGRDPLLQDEFVKSRYLADTYEESLKQLEEFESSPSQEKYEEFLDTYHEAFVSKLERDESGFYDRDDIMSKLNDFTRIMSDLATIDKLMKSYTSGNGYDLYVNTLASEALTQQRKRDLYNANEKVKEVAPQVKEQFSTLSEEEIEDILINSSNADQAFTKAQKLSDNKKEYENKVAVIKDKIREKFVSANRGDLVEEYINNANITTDEKKSLDDADKYIKILNNKEFSDYRNKQFSEFVTEIMRLHPDLTGLLSEDDNQVIYDTLSRDSKIKYHQAAIKYYEGIKKYNGLPKEYIKKQDELIREQQDYIKNLPEEKEVFTQQIGDYIITQEGGNYSVVFKNKYVDSFNSLFDAKQYIENQLTVNEAKSDVKAGDINNLENKFENGYYDPQTFNKNGNRIVNKEQAFNNRINKRILFHEIANGKSEKEISDLIKSNAVIDKYSLDGEEGTIQIFESKDENSGVLKERVLRSLTANAVVINYNHDTLGKIPISTIKDYRNGLGFNKKLLNENQLKFIGDSNYYEFLQKSVVDDTVYNQLKANFPISFKGTPQDQINLINQKQKIFDKLWNGEMDGLEFNRLYTSINTENLGNHNIEDVVYPFALLKDDENSGEYNRYTFFYVPNNFELSNNPKVSFVGLDPEFHSDAKKKIVDSFKKKFKNADLNIFSGYYMLLTDSSGNPSTYKLKNRELSNEEFFETTQQGKDFKQVLILSDNPGVSFSFSVKPEGVFINAFHDDSALSFKVEINSVNDVEKIVPEVYKQLSKEQNWIADGKQIKKSLNTKTIDISLVSKSAVKPTTVEEIIATRQISGINPNNFNVNKIVVREADVVKTDIELMPSVEIQNLEFDDSSLLELLGDEDNTSYLNELFEDEFDGSESVAKRLGINLPNTITYTQVDDFINNLPNLEVSNEEIAKLIVAGANTRMQIEDNPIYLNDVNNIDVNILNKLAPQSVEIISATFNKVNAGNIFTTKIPYKTNIDSSVEERVQSLIKTCFR